MTIITISRGSLRATEMLAEKLSEALHFPVVSREDVLKVAEKYGIKETGLGDLSFVEKAPNFWDKMSDRRKQYLICFQTALFDFALKGSMIYHGHLAHFLLDAVPFLLRIRLVAPPAFRIKTLMEETGKSRKEVISYIKLIDERRQKWSQFLYNVDWKDPAFYDLIINIEKLNLDLAVELITNTISKNEFQSNDESMQILKNLHMASLAKVYLQQSPRTRGSEVEIEADTIQGSLIVKGECPKVGSQMWENDIKTVLSELEGVKNIEVIKSIVGFYK